jgi:hypothetical protein
MTVDVNPACQGCGGPHPFDTSVPSVRWNAVIRANHYPDYLCLTCIVKAFALGNESFTATLWGGFFDGLPISVRVNDQPSIDAAAVSVENTALRVVNADLSRVARGAWHMLQSLLAVRDGIPDDSLRTMAAALHRAIEKAGLPCSD